MLCFNNFLRIRLSSLIGFLVMLIACSDPFSASPYEVNVRSEFKNTTQTNLNKIQLMDSVEDRSFKLALISDSHYHFSSLADAVADINMKGDFSFIVVVGDITENGLLKEFELFHAIMAKSSIPYVTVIGNHDYLSDGSAIYKQMFGANNYLFTFRGVKFIVWDNVIWESEQEADYLWLEQAFETSSDEENGKVFNHVIPLSHIPPSDQQFEHHKDRFHALLKQHNIGLSVHGHRHQFTVKHLFDDEIIFLTVGSPQFRTYTGLTITPDDIVIEKIEY
jgi:3',5'-cyclic-AMP phosphodiesterase